MQRLGVRAPEQVEIAAVADPVLGVVQQGLRLRGAPARIAGPEADDREPALRPADPVRIDRGGRTCDRASRALGLGLGDHQRAAGPGRGQRRALGDAMAAGRREHHLRRVGEPFRLRLQLGRGKQPQRHAERVRQREQRALARLQLDRGDAGDGLPRQIVLGQACPDQLQDLVRPTCRARSRRRAPAPSGGSPDGLPSPTRSGRSRVTLSSPVAANGAPPAVSQSASPVFDAEARPRGRRAARP